jgi:hypothetical protein
MDSNRKTAIIVGVLIIISAVTYMIGGVFFTPIINAPDYLTKLAPNATSVIIGMFFELITAISVVFISVMLFPILKKYNETIAIGHIGFRIIEAVMIIVSEIILLSLLVLSQEYVKAGAPDSSYFQTIATLLINVRFWNADMVLIPVGIAYLMFFSILFKSKLVPRFISVWGIIGMIIFLGVVLFGIFNNNPGILYKFESNLAMVSIPGALSEIVLAIWLIVKGFNSSAIAPGSAKTDTN